MPADLSPEPIPRGRPRSDALHADILWAAARLFGEQGIERTTTRQIALAAQTTERTLFKHFGSKEGLAQAVISEAVLPHLAPASLAGLGEAIAAFGGDLVAWHQALLAARLAALQEAPELTRLLLIELVRDEALRGRFAAQWEQAAWQPLLALFAQLQQQGRVRGDMAPGAMARRFLALNIGFLVTRLVLARGVAMDDGAEIASIAHLFFAGVAGRP
jgi:AcrR family transcriptional regulator